MHSGMAPASFQHHDGFGEMIEIVGGKPGQRIDLGAAAHQMWRADCRRGRVVRAIGGRRGHGNRPDRKCNGSQCCRDRLTGLRIAAGPEVRSETDLMCGRYCITSAPEAIRALFRYREQPNFPARYNVAPTQPVPIVRMAEGEREFALVRWGLIPAWVKDPKDFALLINARGESVNDKPAFKNAMKRRRCLFPADGFYEWKPQATPSGLISRGPWPAGRSPSPAFGKPGSGRMAKRWKPPRSSPPQANAEMAAVHHRAPVIVPPEQFDFWLDCRNVDETDGGRADRAGAGRLDGSL